MKKQLQICLVFCAIIIASGTQAQRYLTEVFSSGDIETMSDITYATNIDFLFSDLSDQAAVAADLVAIQTAIQGGNPIPDAFFNPGDPSTAIKLTNIKMDVRMPSASVDSEEARPAIIYLHTGNFLPPIVNGGISGSKIDSAGVNLAKQWAKRGFVAVNASYRLGWNPIATDPDVRRGTLLNAVYRAFQDIQMCIRYLKANAADLGIDPERIVVYGQGTGGYVANTLACLDQIEELFLPKFIDSNTGTSYVNVDIVGGLDGYGGFLNLYQDMGISSDFAFAANAGGALGDESWMEGGEVPHVSFHCIRDPFAPFDEGTVIVPTTNEDVVDVHGSNFFIQKANDLGNNDAFADFPSDPYTDAARSHYGMTYDYIYPAPNDEITVSETPEGLFPFLKPINDLNVFLNESGPWDWWDFGTLQIVVDGYNAATGANVNATELHQQGLAGNPGMGPVKGLAHIDTIQGYLVPRIVAALDLSTGINDAEMAEVNLDVFPNPASEFVTIETEGEVIEFIELFDLNGRRLVVDNVNNTRYTLDRNNLQNGMYVMNLWIDGRRATTKIVFK
jgi:hypothetical protein